MGSTLLGLAAAALLGGAAAGPVTLPGEAVRGPVAGIDARIAPIQGSWARTQSQCGTEGGGHLTIEGDRLTFGGTGGRICRIGRVEASSLDSVEVHTSCGGGTKRPLVFRLAPGGEALTMRQRVLNVRLERCQ